MTHVLFVVNNYPPKVGGVENHVLSLARTLALRPGVCVSVFTLADREGETVEDGVTVVRLRGRGDIGGVISFPPFGTLRRLRRFARERGVDVVSTQTRFFPMTVLGARLASQLGLRHVHTEHGSAHVSGVGPAVGLASRGVDRTLGQWALRSADTVLGVSVEVCTFVRRLADVEAMVFPNAIDVAAWRNASPGGPARLVFVGRLVSGKGWEAFVDVVERTGVPGEVFGDGPDRARLESLIAQRGLGPLVSVHGSVTPAVLADRLPGAVLVNPTTLSEGFQTTLLETVAAGGCVATYPVPGALDLVQSGAPVRIAEDRDVSSLVAVVRQLLEDPPPPIPEGALRAWDWSARADRFLEVIEGPAAP